ncbi:hypothetical protein ABT298_24325 [Streptomyces sp. NPDC001034]|uniref:hypothetical protein n=1 Tax=Streptomyces sp. NPDC001034 TaxID=3154375 RepID=UPI003331B15E
MRSSIWRIAAAAGVAVGLLGGAAPAFAADGYRQSDTSGAYGTFGSAARTVLASSLGNAAVNPVTPPLETAYTGPTPSGTGGSGGGAQGGSGGNSYGNDNGSGGRSTTVNVMYCIPVRTVSSSCAQSGGTGGDGGTGGNGGNGGNGQGGNGGGSSGAGQGGSGGGAQAGSGGSSQGDGNGSGGRSTTVNVMYCIPVFTGVSSCTQSGGTGGDGGTGGNGGNGGHGQGGNGG